MKRFLFILSLFSLIITSSPVAATSNHNPNDSNGFVKVINLPDDQPQNQPHLSCNVKLEFYNYDQNNNFAQVKFELQAPTNTAQHNLAITSGNLQPFIGGDFAGGSNDLDARETYSLKFSGKPHDKHGYHIKLNIEAPGSQGSTKKHKVFWIKPCASSPQILGQQTTVTGPITELPKTGFESLNIALILAAAAALISYTVAYLRKRSLH